MLQEKEVGTWRAPKSVNMEQNMQWRRQGVNKDSATVITCIVNDWLNFGDLQWQRVLCLLAAWSLVWFLFFIDRIGKIRAYFLGIAPFFTLLISMIFGATLEGADSGIKFYVTPKWESFGTFNVS